MSDAPSDTVIDRRDQDWVETRARLRRFVLARVNDPELAEDITQDVIVRSIASGALDHVDNVSAWLYRSARNAVIDHYRTRRRFDQDAVLESWPEPESYDDLPNDATRDLAHCLQPMMGALHPTGRDALIRVDMEGQTHRQAAEQLGISVSGMKSRVQRARRELKEQLTSCCQVRTDSTGAIADYIPKAQSCGCPDGHDPSVAHADRPSRAKREERRSTEPHGG
ncbi:MAG TPA: sigma-70 family RNA polymerase sigma factor [Nocardioides sp.]|uniref:sigma-70 family RNA polymerase sigma factor n=1 Tax=Nocardioides sp. TaxID=35761 RepID=UPI002E30B779|nr:sigma-70 family RNA polymerase sigma factor [Nocardioides sp.]HEX5086851.1 sigma-70 family RNA polymerase sigma factor [Nocardioides sp.]